MASAVPRVVEVPISNGSTTSTSETEQVGMPTPAVEGRYVGRREPLAYARFIIECGLKLGMEWPTICSAVWYHHRLSSDPKAFQLIDPYTWAMACIKSAGDFDDLPVPDRDVINLAFKTLHPCREKLNLHRDLMPFVKTLVEVQKRLAAFLKCDLSPELPHKYLLQYLYDLDHWIGPKVWPKIPIPKMAWSLLHTFFLSPQVLNFKPQQIALAVIYFALHATGAEIPQSNGTSPWYKVLYEDSTPDIFSKIIEEIICCMDRERELYPKEDPVIPVKSC